MTKTSEVSDVPFFTDSETDVMLGENGTWKATFALLAGDEPDEPADSQSVAMLLKPQTISPKFPWHRPYAIVDADQGCLIQTQFESDVVKPMNIGNAPDQKVKTLSGGELRRVAIVLALALGKPNVNVYLIDKPSSRVFLQRLWQACTRTERISASWTRSSAYWRRRSSNVSSSTRRRRLLLSSRIS